MQPSAPIHASLLKAEYAAAPGEEVYLAVRVTALLPCELHQGRPRRRLRLMDLEGTLHIETTPVRDDRLMQRAAAALACGGVLVARGEFVPHGGGKKTPPGVRLDLASLQPAPPPSTLLGADPALLARTDQLLDQLFKEGRFFEHLCARSYELLSIEPTFSARFRQTIHLVALQALSQGQLPAGSNGRLSVYITSQPSQGKKIFSQLAQLWAPVSKAVQPTMLTPVGLSARVEQGRGGAWQSAPGAIPQCSGGVCIIDDWHRVPEKYMDEVEAVMMSVMEDGKVVPVKAATASYQASCAMLLIANRRADAQGRRRGKAQGVVPQRLAELSLCGELLSRCDVMVELHTGEDPAEGAEQQAAMDDPLLFDLPEEEQAARREIQVLVARLRDRIPKVNLKPVRQDLRLLMRHVALVVRDQCATEHSTLDGDSLLRRMSNAAKKLTAAQARLCGRSVACAADVEVAWEMLSLKMEVLGYICGRGAVAQPLLARAEQVARARSREEARFLRLLHLSGGGRTTLAQAAQAVGMTVKQVGRELWRRGVAPTKEGYLELPTLEEYVQREQERVAQAEREAEAAARRGERLAQAAEKQAAAQAPERPAAPPIEFWRSPEPREADEVEQALQALAAPPPGDPALPEVPRRFNEVTAVVGQLPGDAQRAVEAALAHVISPRAFEESVRGRLVQVRQSVMLGCELAVAARIEGPLQELTGWVLEGGAEGGWALRTAALIVGAGLKGMDYRLETEEERHPLEAVRAGMRAARLHLAKQEAQRLRPEANERRAQRRDSG